MDQSVIVKINFFLIDCVLIFLICRLIKVFVFFFGPKYLLELLYFCDADINYLFDKDRS